MKGFGFEYYKMCFFVGNCINWLSKVFCWFNLFIGVVVMKKLGYIVRLER